MNSEEMVAIYRAAGEMEARIIQSKLASHGIPCLLKSNAAFSAHAFVVDGMGEVRIMVWDSVATAARNVISGEERV